MRRMPLGRGRWGGELSSLERLIGGLPDSGNGLRRLEKQLAAANRALWDAEDEIRRLMGGGAAVQHVAEIAMAICRMNDRRVGLKQQINAAVRSREVDEKVYGDGAVR